MSSNLPINKQIEKYIDEHSLKLHPVQDEIIKYNDTLGKKKKLLKLNKKKKSLKKRIFN